MEKIILNEAFSQLELLDEDVYDLSDVSALKEINDFDILDDVDDEVDVFDFNTETEEELKDDYIGKVVLRCSVCHTDHFANPEEVIVDDELNLANVGEECKYCYSNDGYKIIGKIAPFVKEEKKEIEEEFDEDEEEEFDEESFDELDENYLKEAKADENTEKNAATKYEQYQYEYKQITAGDSTSLGTAKISNVIDNVYSAVNNPQDFNKISLRYLKTINDWFKGSTFTKAGNEIEYWTKRLPVLIKSCSSAIKTYRKTSLKDKFKSMLSKFKGFEKRFAMFAKKYNEISENKEKFSKKITERIKDLESEIAQDKNWEKWKKDQEQRDIEHQKEMDRKDRENEKIKKEMKRKGYTESCKGNNCRKSKILKEAPTYDLHPRYDSRQSFYNKARIETGDNNDQNKLYSYNTLVAEIKDGKPVVYGTYSPTTLRHIKEWLKQNGFKAENSKQILADYGVKNEFLDFDLDILNGNKLDDIANGNDLSLSLIPEEKECKGRKCRKPKTLKESDKPATTSIEDAQKWVDYDMKKYGKISERTNKLVKKAGFQIIKDDHGDYEVAAGKFESLKKSKNESFEKVELSGDDQKVEVSQEGTKVNISVETAKDVEETEEIEEQDETIVPLEVVDEEEPEIPQEDEEVAEEEPQEDEEELEEFDEESFDELGENYLKEVYENVKSFKTTNIKQKGNKLVVEGVIGFESGNNKKTSFLFENVKTKNNKKRFIGENKQITRGKKAFSLTGSINNKKFISESLRYNYQTKDSEGKSQRLYGTITKK